MALWSYFGDRRSFRRAIKSDSNQNVGRRLVNGQQNHRGRSISETNDSVLEDVEEEIPSTEGTSPTESCVYHSLPSYQGSLHRHNTLFKRWMASRNRSVDESSSTNSLNRRVELLNEQPVAVHYHRRPAQTNSISDNNSNNNTSEMYSPNSRQRVRHSSAPVSNLPLRLDPHFINKNLIDVKEIVHQDGEENEQEKDEDDHSRLNLKDVWIPRRNYVYRKVTAAPNSHSKYLPKRFLLFHSYMTSRFFSDALSAGHVRTYDIDNANGRQQRPNSSRGTFGLLVLS